MSENLKELLEVTILTPPTVKGSKVRYKATDTFTKQPVLIEIVGMPKIDTLAVGNTYEFPVTVETLGVKQYLPQTAQNGHGIKYLKSPEHPKAEPKAEPKTENQTASTSGPKVIDTELVEVTEVLDQVPDAVPVGRSLFQPTKVIFPEEEQVRAMIARYDLVKSEIVKPSDYEKIQGKDFLKKSGWRKFINAFGLSIELIDKRIFEQFGDKHAEVRVRAIAPSAEEVKN